jgi:DNA polymerase-3 subunit delta
MQIRSDALAAQLKRGLAPVYTVWGDEPLLMQEACDAISISTGAACSARHRR